MPTYKDRMFDKDILEVIQDRVNQLKDEHWNTDE